MSPILYLMSVFPRSGAEPLAELAEFGLSGLEAAGGADLAPGFAEAGVILGAQVTLVIDLIIFGYSAFGRVIR